MEEIWKKYNERYEVSNFGRVRHVLNKKVRKTPLNHKGYPTVCIKRDDRNRCGIAVHRMVAEVFIPNPNNLPQVNHKNGIKTDNRVENLEWITNTDNMRHAFQVLGRKALSGIENGMASFTQEDINYIRTHYIPYDREFGINGLAKKFGVCSQTVGRVVRNQTYKN